ncbi:MAG: translation initiation factor IF-3 [Selenomonadaceae bacterium]|nr:translation initiation factor IF-3 [Selenomonadaceae bacterium]
MIREQPRINDEIHVREVRVTGVNGDQLGIMATRDALRMAEEAHLDLVEIAPKARPPVCRIMDFGKFRYEQQKREKEARKKQKIVTMKEVKLRPGIEDHDFDVKLKAAAKFLAEGNKVKATIMFRGRELSHPELGSVLLEKLAAALTTASVERQPKLEGKNMTMILSPRRDKSAKDKNASGGGEAVQRDRQRQVQAQQGVQKPHTGEEVAEA